MTFPTGQFTPSKDSLTAARAEALTPAIRKSFLSSAISVMIFGAILFPYSPVGLAIWLVIRVIASAGSLAALKRMAASSLGPERTIKALAAVMAISGTVWGIIPLLIRPEEPEWRAVVVLWLFGNQSVVTVVCSPSRLVFRAANGSVTLIGIASILLYGDSFSLVLAGILLLGGVYSLSIFGATHQTVSSAIEGRMTAATLAQSLTEQQAELTSANAALAHMANHDELTNSLNRRSFAAVVADERGSLTTSGWLAYIDIDHFKSVNDRHGHAAGDTVLAMLAQRWRRTLPPGGILSRSGGDEFAVWFQASTPHEALQIAERLPASLEQPIAISAGTVIDVSCSVGITHGIAGESYSTAAARADLALYEVKTRGRNGVVMDTSAARPASDPTPGPTSTIRLPR